MNMLDIPAGAYGSFAMAYDIIIKTQQAVFICIYIERKLCREGGNTSHMSTCVHTTLTCTPITTTSQVVIHKLETRLQNAEV